MTSRETPRRPNGGNQRLAIVEFEAFSRPEALIATPDQLVMCQTSGENANEFATRVTERLDTFSGAKKAFMYLSRRGKGAPRMRIARRVGTVLKRDPGAELALITAPQGERKEVAWDFLDRLSREPALDGVNLCLRSGHDN